VNTKYKWEFEKLRDAEKKAEHWKGIELLFHPQPIVSKTSMFTMQCVGLQGFVQYLKEGKKKYKQMD